MEAFYQLESSAINTNNNPLINLIKDMVSTLKKSAATLTAVSSAEKVDPSLIVCKCKFIFKLLHFRYVEMGIWKNLNHMTCCNSNVFHILKPWRGIS